MNRVADWERVRRSYRRRMAVWRAVRVGLIGLGLAAMSGAIWVAVVAGAICFL
jgi:hypothetical protein